MHFSVRKSIHTYISTDVPKSCVRNSSYTPWWILFIHIHSDQRNMEMAVNIGVCDVASFTWVMGLCHGGGTFVSCRHISSSSSNAWTSFSGTYECYAFLVLTLLNEGRCVEEGVIPWSHVAGIRTVSFRILCAVSFHVS